MGNITKKRNQIYKNLNTYQENFEKDFIANYAQQIIDLPVNFFAHFSAKTKKNNISKIEYMAIIRYLESKFEMENEKVASVINLFKSDTVVSSTVQEELKYFSDDKKAKNYFYLKFMSMYASRNITDLTYKKAKDLVGLIQKTRNSEEWANPIFGKSELTEPVDKFIQKMNNLDIIYNEIKSQSFEKIFSNKANEYLKSIIEAHTINYSENYQKAIKTNVSFPDKTQIETYKLAKEFDGLNRNLINLQNTNGKKVYRPEKKWVSYSESERSEMNALDVDHSGWNKHPAPPGYWKEEEVYDHTINNSKKITEIKGAMASLKEKFTKLDGAFSLEDSNFLNNVLTYWKPYFANEDKYVELNSKLTEEERELVNLYYDQDFTGLVDKLKLSGEEIKKIEGILDMQENSIKELQKLKCEAAARSSVNDKSSTSPMWQWKSILDKEKSDAKDLKMETEESKSSSTAQFSSTKS